MGSMSDLPVPSPRACTLRGGPSPRLAVTGWILIIGSSFVASFGSDLAESARMLVRGGVAPLLVLVGAILIVQASRKQSFTRIDVDPGGSVLVTTEVVNGGAPDVSRVDLAPGRMLITQQEDRFEWVILVQNDVNLPLIKLPRDPTARLRFLHALERLLLPPTPPVPAGEPGA
jgi:hypothetical protein